MPTTGDHSIGGLGVTKISRDGKILVGDVNDSRGFKNAGVWTADAMAPAWANQAERRAV